MPRNNDEKLKIKNKIKVFSKKLIIKLSIMKTIKTLLVIVTLLIGTISFAQSHNTTTGSTCKYAKNRCTNMEGCPQCAACDADDKKEKDAKIAEVKKRNEKIWADAKIKKDAEQKAYQDKLAADNAEAKSKAESGDVVINGQETDKNLNKGNMVNDTTSTVIKKTSSDKLRLYGTEIKNDDGLLITKILDQNDSLIIESSKFIASKWDDTTSEIPMNMIIIQELKQSKYNADYYNSNYYGYFNIINALGEKILEEEEINFLKYVGNGFFIYTYFESTYDESQKKRNLSTSPESCGSKMVIFDIIKNKKHYFQPNNEYGENNSYCISHIASSTKNNDLFLFRFIHFVRTEKWGGDYEHYVVKKDRSIILESRQD